jgi:hypothetical protein
MEPLHLHNLLSNLFEYRISPPYAACFFFDVGLYFPKASITSFYWWLVPVGFRRMRIALYISTAYLIGALVASILTDLLVCRPISDNW